MILLASDIGSTTTKLVAFRYEEGKLVSLGAVQEPTTVEAPFSDVCIGLFRAVEKLSAKIGCKLSESDLISVPYYTTSSAGGGLQVLVVGYTLADSCNIARATAFSAGAVISGSFAIDSERNRLELIDKMSRPNPDLVLMAGGTEGGALSGVVTMAYMLNHARPLSKYGEGKLPLLFCGNSHARKFVRDALDSYFQMSTTENVIPENRVINLLPAIEQVQRIFMEHVMQKAPGYCRVTEMVAADVKPTPKGVSDILQAFGKRTGSDLVLVDMGGATTDIFSSMAGEMRRTVAGNIGMSYSMSNTLSEAGIDAVMRHLPGAEEEDVRRWTYGKSLFPTVVPDCPEAEEIEAAVAVEGLRLSWKMHLETGYQHARPGFRDFFSTRRCSSINPAMETLSEKRCSFHTAGILIGAGGIFSHASDVRAAWMLAEGFRPPGLTTLYVDSHFHSPHMGALLNSFPDAAVDYYSNQCLKPVCRVLSPPWKITGLFAKIETPDRTRWVGTGSWLYLPDTTDCMLSIFGPGIPGVEHACDGLPLLIDCRRSGKALPLDFRKDFRSVTSEITPPFRKAENPSECTSTFTLSLPFDGKINVKPGDSVESGECLGRIAEIPPRQFVLDVRNARVCSKELTDNQVMEMITVNPGDEVKKGDDIFRHNTGSYIETYKSQVDGTVGKVLLPGVVMMEENMNHDSLAHTVSVSRKMGVSPGKLSKYMRVDTGDFVYRGQVLCNDPPVSICQAPCPGFVTDIDYEKGTLTICYNMTPIMINNPMAGTVIDTDFRRSVTVSALCLEINGVLGFGKNVRGKLVCSPDAVEEGGILITDKPVTVELLRNAAGAGATGVAAPSIYGKELVSWLCREPGLFITGGEETEVSLLLFQGIGDSQLSQETWNSLRNLSGTEAALFPVTKIRAGSVRPFLAISSNGNSDR